MLLLMVVRVTDFEIYTSARGSFGGHDRLCWSLARAWFWGRIPLVGPALNVVYNMKQQRLSYASVGGFLSNHLGPGEELRGKRVGLLEDVSKL